MTFDVIVVGAGMAGLAAARMLAEAGRRVVVLEAGQDVGGRIRTVRVGGEALELGAEFVHGRPAELWALIEEAGLETYERQGDFVRLQGEELLGEAEDHENDAALEALEDYAGPDCSFADYVARQELSEWRRTREIGYVEGFNAADAREASVLALGRQQKAEDAIEGDRTWKVVGGYDQVPRYLWARAEAAGAQFAFDAEVTAVEWSAGAVTVRCADGRTYEGAAAVVTLPLGVLQQRRVAFAPEVPQVMEAANAMRAGVVCRFTMLFRRRFWQEDVSFVLTPELPVSVWWTVAPAETSILTGWVGGPRALPLLALSAAELRRTALDGVAAIFLEEAAMVEEELVSFETHDWTAEGGAYSWVPVGGLEASARMSEPVERTLFFAGEHTDTTGHWGTVHAAYGSGLRAGRQALDFMGS